MLIACPTCATSYRVEPSSAGATGRSVRCVRCRAVWFIRDAAAMSAIAQGLRSDLAKLTGVTPSAELVEEPLPASLPAGDPPAGQTDAEPAPAEATALDPAPLVEVPPPAAELPRPDRPQT